MNLRALFADRTTVVPVEVVGSLYVPSVKEGTAEIATDAVNIDCVLVHALISHTIRGLSAPQEHSVPSARRKHYLKRLTYLGPAALKKEGAEAPPGWAGRKSSTGRVLFTF